jgi:hypothetical protein
MTPPSAEMDGISIAYVRSLTSNRREESAYSDNESSDWNATAAASAPAIYTGEESALGGGICAGDRTPASPPEAARTAAASAPWHFINCSLEFVGDDDDNYQHLIILLVCCFQTQETASHIWDI